MVNQRGGWGLLTTHARVLLALAHDPGLRLREIAAACQVTERTAQSIVDDLQRAGCLSRERDGRRMRYTLHLDATLNHPAEPSLPLRRLLALFADVGGKR